MKVCIYNGKIVTPNEVIKGNLYIEMVKSKKLKMEKQIEIKVIQRLMLREIGLCLE